MIENSYIQNSLIILFLPLVAFLIQIFVGKRLPRQGDWVSITAIVTTLMLSLYMFVSMLQKFGLETDTFNRSTGTLSGLDFV